MIRIFLLHASTPDLENASSKQMGALEVLQHRHIFYLVGAVSTTPCYSIGTEATFEGIYPEVSTTPWLILTAF
jgi:hypothetical protein